MKFISVSSVLTVLVFIYLGNTLWSLGEIFLAPRCSKGERCVRSYLAPQPVQHLILFTSATRHPSSNQAAKVHTVLNFDYYKTQNFDLEMNVDSVRRRNRTLFLHVGLVDERDLYSSFESVQSLCTIPLVTHMPPQASTFSLLNQDDPKSKNAEKKPEDSKLIPHIDTQVEFAVMTDNIKAPFSKMPQEFQANMRLQNDKFFPLIQHNYLKSRIKNLVPLEKEIKAVNVTVSYSPTSFGMYRLMMHMKLTLHHLQSMGFNERDVDDVKGIFADTNLYLLAATIIIASFHLLFDFLAFKNDISFWRRKKSMVGLSTRTIVWRAFSTCIIFLYLMEENTTPIVLVPAFISVLIELWKTLKVLRVGLEWKGWTPLRLNVGLSQAEQQTQAIDAEAMRYLLYLVYPLCVGGAVYSLLYQPHKSWYSWTITSLVNGVYAFGFLFMLPQLFVNYRLRSVAALPWRSFMYKAFNTFIDDVFAFVITMPTAHRIACFRDDIVFLIYLYQRWLYPVDASRTDDSLSMSDDPSAEKKAEKPKQS